jgi:RimJ/RimL family protein N-acetyltransferase
MFQLETDRLLIRQWRDDERDAFVRITSNSEVTEFVHGGRPYSDQEIDDFFARQRRQLAEHDVCMGALVEKETGRIVGISGVQPLGTTADLEIGWILERDSWGRGYATEAGRAAMNHVLHTLARPRVVAIIDPLNAPSKAVAARLGMTYDRLWTGVELGHRIPELAVDLFYRNNEQD